MGLQVARLPAALRSLFLGPVGRKGNKPFEIGHGQRPAINAEARLCPMLYVDIVIHVPRQLYCR